MAAPGEVAAAVLVGGARETPGSAAAGVGVAAAEEGAGSAVRVGSDSKESPISASTNGVPKERYQNKPQKSNQNNQLSHRYNGEQKEAKSKVQFKSSPIRKFWSFAKQNPNFNQIKVVNHPVITNK